MLSVKQGGIKYHFWVFGMNRPGIEPRTPGLLANTLLDPNLVELILKPVLIYLNDFSNWYYL